jgi:hypothetical protein
MSSAISSRLFNDTISGDPVPLRDIHLRIDLALF